MLQRRIGARDYTLVPHRAIGHLAEQIYALTRLAFGSYAGVLVPSPEHRDWYVRRPGMDADLSVAVLCEGRLVSNVFVTVAALRLGGGLLPAGIVDTVMTHPAHRRQGLARWALETAIAGMRDRGLAASLLYTVAGSMPAALYGSLGYRAQAPVRYYRALPGAHGRPRAGSTPGGWTLASTRPPGSSSTPAWPAATAPSRWTRPCGAGAGSTARRPCPPSSGASRGRVAGRGARRSAGPPS